MQTKLTLRMDDELIARAKAHAKKRGKSVSQLVADFFYVLEKVEEKPRSEKKYGPITESLVGILKGAQVDEEDYYRYLKEKYR